METLVYLAKTNLYLVLFYCTFWLLLRKLTFFQWNRFFLLGAIVFSFLLPAIVFYAPAPEVIPATEMVQSAPAQLVATIAQEDTFDPTKYLLLAYGIGCTIMLVNLLKSLYRLFVLVKNGERIPQAGYTLLILNKQPFPESDCGSFSFFKWLVVNRRDYESNPETILRHELVHIRQWHSLDILLIELLKVVFWINPVVWLYKLSMQAVHEFLADRGAENRDRYARFLVSYALKVPEEVLTNHFSNSALLKDRIQMIYKGRTSNWSRSKYLLIVPIIAVAVFSTAARKYLPQQAASGIIATTDYATITGTVSDQEGNRIPSAIIVVKNTNQGAASDQNGNFELTNVPENASLVVSHIQYVSKELAVSREKLSYDFVIEPDDAVLQEPTITATQRSQKPAIPNTVQPQKPESSTFRIAEQKPQFPGGHEAMVEYLRSNIKYPAPALEANVEGVVIVRFTVDKQGALQNVVIVKGVGFGMDAESIRLVKGMPKWQPGIQNGEAIAMNQTIEVKFDLATVKGDKRQGFHLPDTKPRWSSGLKVAKFEIDDLLAAPLSFFEENAIKPSSTPPRNNYRYIPDSSSYRFMNYNTPFSKDETRFRIVPSGQYKFQKTASESPK